MPEPNGAPDWLDQAERDAKAVIERLYIEGRTALTDEPAGPAEPGATPPSVTVPEPTTPTPTAPPTTPTPATPPAAPTPAAPPVAPPAGPSDSAAAAVLAAAAASGQGQPGGTEPSWPDSGPAAHRRPDGTEPR